MDVRGRCHKVDELYNVEVGEGESCADNTKYKNYFGYCFSICPPDKPVPGKDRNCHACDEEEPFELSFYTDHGEKWSNRDISVSSKFCGLCPNREIVLEKTFSDYKRWCAIKGSIFVKDLEIHNITSSFEWAFLLTFPGLLIGLIALPFIAFFSGLFFCMVIRFIIGIFKLITVIILIIIERFLPKRPPKKRKIHINPNK